MAQVVQAHAAPGIKIQPCKTKLFWSEVEYLGHKISKAGVLMIPEFLQKIKDWPVPKSGKEVSTFVGVTRYYRSFIPQYSALTNQLNRDKKAEKFLWNKETERDFMELKRAFTEGGIQAFPDFEAGGSFILTTNWSKENITRVLSQVQDRQERSLEC